jgi:hypothetical protein
MSIIEKTRTTIRRLPRWAWLAGSGVLLLSGAVLLFIGLRSDPAVMGFVRLDEQPLPTGSIRFVPLGGKGPDAGASIREGKYRIEKGLIVGKYKVEIRGTRETGKKERDAFGQLVARIETIEFADADDLIREVQAGTQEFDFKLTEKKARKLSR